MCVEGEGKVQNGMANGGILWRMKNQIQNPRRPFGHQSSQHGGNARKDYKNRHEHNSDDREHSKVWRSHINAIDQSIEA